MNYSIIFYIVGWILKFEGFFLVLPLIVSLIYKEDTYYAYLIVGLICFGIGSLMSHGKRENVKLYAREGFISVSLSWILISVFGAMPFVITGDIPSYIDALFEIISGFTTTGASILKDVESISRAGLFWRCFSHWIGGMGVFVFMMAIVPLMGGSTMNLMRAESPGPSVDKLVPHVKDTAKILYSIYLGMTIIEVVLLCLGGMPLYESLNTSFGTVGTGGFGVKNDSMMSYKPLLQNIVTVFMILSGVNYVAYFYIISKKWKNALKVEEVRWYFIIIFVSIALLCIDTRHIYKNIFDGIRHASFQVGSIITTTGFATCDFDLWPQFSKTILIILMFVGACAGSTGGGIKVSRLVILLKTVRKELSLLIHPREVRKIHVDGRCVNQDVIRSTNVFIVAYFCILFISVLLIGVDGKDFTTNFTAVAATLNNIGPGMALVGPTQNYSIFSGFSKFVLMFDMLVGRLEIFPMLLLFLPASWKKN